MIGRVAQVSGGLHPGGTSSAATSAQLGHPSSSQAGPPPPRSPSELARHPLNLMVTQLR